MRKGGSRGGRKGGRNEPGAEAGFTLVEMLVALVLLALVGLTLARFQSVQLDGAARVVMLSAARLEADNRAIALAVMPQAPDTVLAGTSANAGLSWHWRAVPGPSPDPARAPDLVAITVSVAAREGGAPLATRTLVRPRLLPAEGGGL